MSGVGLEHTSFAVNLLELSYLNSPATNPLNGTLTSSNTTFGSLPSNTLHIPHGVVRNAAASGHVSGVGVPRVRNTLRISPSWLPSSWVGGDSKIGVGLGEAEAHSERRTPKDHMSDGVE